MDVSEREVSVAVTGSRVSQQTWTRLARVFDLV
jgi:hypothetical protein